MIWQGFPLFCYRSSSSKGKFFGAGVILSSHEDAESWDFLFEYLKTKVSSPPKVNLSDGDGGITKSLKKQFHGHTRRCMCFSHVYNNTRKRIKSIESEDKNDILNDIKTLQWSVPNEKTFDVVYDLLVKKWKSKAMGSRLKSLVKEFFDDYFTPQWVASELKYLFEMANPFHLGNNQGLEGTNKAIKDSHTFRLRMRIPAFFNCMFELVTGWSEKDDAEIFESRFEHLELKEKDAGYEWKILNDKPGKILSLPPTGQLTILNDENHILYGRVNKLWLVPSASLKKNENMKDLAKEVLKLRKNLDYQSFNHYLKIRQKIYVLEEVEFENCTNDFFL